MALFSWLFGKGKSKSDAPVYSDRWTVSENGNPTLLEGSTGITIFKQDRGWNYCIADVDDQNAPYFSEAFFSEQDAREKALAHFRGQPPDHQPLSASFAEERRHSWEEHIRERSRLIEELERFFAENPDLGITALRKPEAKIASHLKQLDWQAGEYRSLGVSAELVSLAERQRPALAKLAEEVATRLEAKQAQRPPRKQPVSDSQLPTELATKVDDLIRLFARTPVEDPSEAERRYGRAMNDATAKMLKGGMTFGEASGGPDFLNQDEASFRAFMKKADQDLGWQCDTVSNAFKRYLEIGETPAPHYPMRVAVLLRKAKDFDREKQFLAAWCKHFPTGNGLNTSRSSKGPRKPAQYRADR